MAPGANYMGGKRNAARARSKDATGRRQKTFFSRQRLDILSKGLAGRAPSGGSSSGYGPRVTASDIALSHARHPATHPPVAEDQNTIPTAVGEPATSIPKIPRNAHKRSSSGSMRSSKVLEALDTTEPIAMRAAISKILSIPDLAGLSARPNVHTPPTTGSKRSRPLDSDLGHTLSQSKVQKTRNAPSCSPSQSFEHQDFDEPDAFQAMDVDYETDAHPSNSIISDYQPASFSIDSDYTDFDCFLIICLTDFPP
ncbi:hypothetical protein B0H15DRAFT_956713 [Mycena belliarum]|uniref:Uncharacterized protein n=1 Tax=Mycena belliarum TaxID=1033014 RepID=A0AAD6TQN4_9AGAR|nr:hypothetical protein B0H15DRAFT_956713 [Mycena belliae]